MSFAFSRIGPIGLVVVFVAVLAGASAASAQSPPPGWHFRFESLTTPTASALRDLLETYHASPTSQREVTVKETRERNALAYLSTRMSEVDALLSGEQSSLPLTSSGPWASLAYLYRRTQAPSAVAFLSTAARLRTLVSHIPEDGDVLERMIIQQSAVGTLEALAQQGSRAAKSALLDLLPEVDPGVKSALVGSYYRVSIDRRRAKAELRTRLATSELFLLNLWATP